MMKKISSLNETKKTGQNEKIHQNVFGFSNSREKHFCFALERKQQIQHRNDARKTKFISVFEQRKKNNKNYQVMYKVNIQFESI